MSHPSCAGVFVAAESAVEQRVDLWKRCPGLVHTRQPHTALRFLGTPFHLDDDVGSTARKVISAPSQRARSGRGGTAIILCLSQPGICIPTWASGLADSSGVDSAFARQENWLMQVRPHFLWNWRSLARYVLAPGCRALAKASSHACGESRLQLRRPCRHRWLSTPYCECNSDISFDSQLSEPSQIGTVDTPVCWTRQQRWSQRGARRAQ